MNMTATELMERDARFRARVMSAVAQAMEEARSQVDEGALRWRDVHHIATEAAVMALKSAFEGNAELIALRIERDHYRTVALGGLQLQPIPVVMDRR